MNTIAKPAALKRLEGTYRKDRDAAREQSENFFRQFAFAKGTRLPCPAIIQTEYCRAYWQELTGWLIGLGVLCPVDLPQLEALCFTLEKLRELQVFYQEASPLSENYDRIAKAHNKLSRRFDELANKYYISPAARARLRLEALQATKTAQEISAIETLLAERGA